MTGAPQSAEEALFIDLLRLGHRAWMMAHGTSMRPFISPGARVLIEPPPFIAPPLDIGDVVLAVAGGHLRLHRLVGAAPDGGLILKGDAFPAPDPPIDPGGLLGRAIRVDGPGLASWPLCGPERALGRLAARVSMGVFRARRRWS